jgi:hypothetical protein
MSDITVKAEKLLSMICAVSVVTDDDAMNKRLPWAQKIRGDLAKNPKGWKKCSVKDFSAKFFTQKPYCLNLEAVQTENGIESRVMLYYSDGTGLSLVEVENGINLYRFGCFHSYVKVEKLGKCLWKLKCSNCGAIKTVDSSD